MSDASFGVLARFANLPHFLYNCLRMMRQSIEGRLNVRATGSMDVYSVRPQPPRLPAHDALADAIQVLQQTENRHSTTK